MLRSLSIRNFALISRLNLDFSTGFTAITGETGSGKSILLGALNLIRGERADYSVIRNPEEKTVVEAEFVVPPGLVPWFAANDVDFSPETILRREISAQGKSRAFVNDTPVQLTQLKELADLLIYIHSQHETLALRNPDFQLEIIDAFAGTLDLKRQFLQLYTEWKQALSELRRHRELSANAERELDFLGFQHGELEELQLEKINYNQLETELSRLENADELRAVYSALSEGLNTESGAIDQLRQLRAQLDRLKGTDEQLAAFATRLNVTLVELDDLSSEAARSLESLESDPQRLVELTNKVDRFNAVLLKNHLQNQEELLALYREVSDKLSAISHSDERLAELQEKVSSLEKNVSQLGMELHKKRAAVTGKLESALTGHLSDLKLPDTRLLFQLTERREPVSSGYTDVSLLFSANPGQALKPVDKAASGGELSRLMLVIQRILGEHKSLPTLIFDEIDTGVSGEVAIRIGNMLKAMGQHIQLFAITHLPQVAASAGHHLEVTKSVEEGITESRIKILESGQRRIAIAKLLSGDEPTPTALANAETLLNP